MTLHGEQMLVDLWEGEREREEGRKEGKRRKKGDERKEKGEKEGKERGENGGRRGKRIKEGKKRRDRYASKTPFSIQILLVTNCT